jgi:hypothetical protein
MRTRHVVSGLLMALAASPAWAEVSDKIPSLEGMWVWAVGFNLAAALLSLWRPAIGLAVAPVAAFYAWAGHEMVSDPHVGRAILKEQGEGYVEQVYASGVVGVIGPLLIVGLIAALRQRAASARAV